MFKRRVEKFIEDKSLFGLNDKLLIALSGGADSVALLRVLWSLGYDCECAHCNFHLRGEESNRDEAFVRHLCNELSVPLHLVHFDTESFAKEHHVSIEMAARELRYGWFESLRKERGASFIAVAHHRDDSVETFMLNLIRGTGINGLKGIAVKNDKIVRPLLQESRESILDYLNAIHQDYVTDSTNLQDEFIRNKIRLTILPLMKEINPSISESIQETSYRLAEVAAIYQQDRTEAIRQKLIRISEHQLRISIEEILTDKAPHSLLHEILSPLGFNNSQIKSIYRSLTFSQSGKRFLSANWEVIRDRHELLIHELNSNDQTPEILIEELEKTSSFIIPNDKCIACIDAEKINQPLFIRKWEKGDKFIPLGMNGQKKISDYLTDKKYTLYQKNNQYVVYCGERIVWLVNERIDNRYRITDNTQKIIRIQMKKG